MHLTKLTAPQFAGLVLIWLGGFAALRWIFRLELLAMAVPGFREIGLVAPLMLLSGGMACWLLGNDGNGVLGSPHRRLLTVCTGMLAVFPALMLLEHFSGIALGIDFHHAEVLPTRLNPHPGRMSPNACIGFFLASGVLWIMRDRLTRARATATATLIAGIALIGGMGCIGHFMNLERLYTFGAANRLTLPVAYGLVILSSALWLLRDRWVGDTTTSLTGHEKRIGQRSVVVLAFVAVAAGVGGFAIIQQSLEQSQSDGLLLTATANADALTNSLEASAWFPRTVSTRPTVSKSINHLNAAPSDTSTVEFLRQVGLSFLTAGVRGVRFLDASGAEIVTVGTLMSHGAEAVLELAPPLSGSRLVWQEGFYLRSNYPVVEQGKEVGRVVTEQPLPLFDKLTTNIRQASATADVLICSRVADAASCVPTRFYSAPFKIPMFDTDGKPTLPINRALLGQVGTLVTKDLRGTSVLAAYTPLERTGLALVVKVDVETIYAPLRERVNSLVLLLVMLVGTGWLALRSQVRPLVVQMGAHQRRTRVILENSNDAFIAIGADGRITDWNSEARRTFGWSPEEAIGQQLSELIIPADQRAAHEAGFARFKQSGTGPIVNQRLDVAALHKDGHTFMAELSVASFFDGDGYVAHAFMRDITEALAAQKMILDSEHLLRGITDNVPVAIAYIDHQEHLLFANKTFGEWLGVDPQVAVKRPLRLLGASLYDGRPDMLEAALQGERASFESVLNRPDGGMRHLHTTYVPDARPDGQIVGIYALTSDVTAAKEVERHLEQLSRVDQLTGLSNRRSLEERLDQAMARSRRSKRPMALVFMDLDHFKQINDTHGHAVGDAVLKAFATRLQAAIRLTDLAARLGGDEFVVVIESLNTVEEASIVSEKLVSAIRPVVAVGALSLRVTASMGLAYYDGDESSAEALVAKADGALYRAKAAGRDTLVATLI